MNIFVNRSFPTSASGRVKGKRRGAIVPLAVAMMIMFIGAVAFSLDIGYMELTRIQLRAATDAAARAAGEALTREQSLDAAILVAKQTAAANLVAGNPLNLADEDIIPGNSSYQDNGTWAFTANAEPINSIRVIGRRTAESPSGSVSLFFGRIFNVYDFEPTQLSTVVRTDRDICLVVDRSSSMKLDINSTQEGMSTSHPGFCEPPDPVNSRWAALASAVQVFFDTLDVTPQREFVALASYASDYSSCSITNAASSRDQELDSDYTLVINAMETYTNKVFNGNTNISAGIESGTATLVDPSYARPYALKTMILLTDGIRTDGPDPAAAAEQAHLNGIIIHTITFGAVADQGAMQAVAQITGGKHYHAPDAESLENIYREIALSLSVTFID